MAAKPKPKPKSKSYLKVLIQERDGLQCLMVESLGGVSPAGWRLQKGAGFPIDEFMFFDEGEARIAARKLQEYLNKA